MGTINWYEDEKFYYVRKPYGMPTTFGSQFSYLEYISQELPSFFVELSKIWTREEEWGLLNRLDNDTAGLLYFAKSKEIAEWYKTCQDAEKITKRYICDVQGDMSRFTNTDTHIMWADAPCNAGRALCVSYPLMHHAYDEQKMIVVRHPRDAQKGRGTMHMVKTYFVPLYYDEKTNTTTAYALISKGIRHQIRVHAAGMGYVLQGDLLYKGTNDEHLHLRSVGLSIEE